MTTRLDRSVRPGSRGPAEAEGSEGRQDVVGVMTARRAWAVGVRRLCVFLLLCLCACGGTPPTAGPAGVATVPPVDLFVSPGGDDAGSGVSRSDPLRTLGGAWERIPEGSGGASGYRINLLPGVYPFSQCADGCLNYFADRHGTRARPLILTAADGAGTATIRGGLNLARVSYLTISQLTLEAGGVAGAFDNNVVHLEACDHVTLLGLVVRGLVQSQFQEVVKANQVSHLDLLECDVSGAYQTGIDYFAVQHGRLAGCRVHDAGEWAAYFKGGSAYLRVEGNEFHDCGLGVSVGEGSNFEVFVYPWLHYEAYDVKVVNNLLHDVPGVGLRVAGGYNVLFAHNTLYGVAYGDVGYGLLGLTHGARVCQETDPPDGGAACRRHQQAGGWGPSACCGPGGEYIPNRHVLFYHNLFYNPAGVQTAWSHFDLRGALVPPAGWNLPNPSRADDGVRLRGNVVWNGPADHPLGIDDGSGCQPANPTCSEAQLLAENYLNRFEPELVNPAAGDFRPRPGGNVAGLRADAIPDFSWSDVPSRPAVPPGDPGNGVAVDHDGLPRTGGNPPGAYTVRAR